MHELPSTNAGVRKQRADAQQNRERILQAAHQAFVEHGAAVAMDDIARLAAVGSGTLYRHFPTRELLIEAVYKDEVEKLIEAGQHFLTTSAPVDALRSWMLLFIDHVANKWVILPALDTVAGGSMRLVKGSHELIHDTFLQLVQNAKQSGSLRADIEPRDVVRALMGVFFTTALPGWEESARRIVDILIDGTRAPERQQ
jgi:AcrR family transcriptional regulator